MSSEKHTPGPWKAYKSGKRWNVGVESPLGGGGTIGRMTCLWDVANGSPQHGLAAEANARLIAAAPALLEALTKIRDEMQAWHSGGDPRSADWPERRIKIADAAINAATEGA